MTSHSTEGTGGGERWCHLFQSVLGNNPSKKPFLLQKEEKPLQILKLNTSRRATQNFCPSLRKSACVQGKCRDREELYETMLSPPNIKGGRKVVWHTRGITEAVIWATVRFPCVQEHHLAVQRKAQQYLLTFKRAPGV